TMFFQIRAKNFFKDSVREQRAPAGRVLTITVPIISVLIMLWRPAPRRRAHLKTAETRGSEHSGRNSSTGSKKTLRVYQPARRSLFLRMFPYGRSIPNGAGEPKTAPRLFHT